MAGVQDEYETAWILSSQSWRIAKSQDLNLGVSGPACLLAHLVGFSITETFFSLFPC